MQLPFEVQTRTHCGELKYWFRLRDAFIYADSNEDVWKISFPAGPNERCRLIKKNAEWVYEDVMTKVLDSMNKMLDEKEALPKDD